VQFFGTSLGTRELEALAQEVRAATLGVAGAELGGRIDRFQRAIADLRLGAPREEGRHEYASLEAGLATPLAELRITLDELSEGLASVGAGLDVDKLEQPLAQAAERLSLLVSADGELALSGSTGARVSVGLEQRLTRQSFFVEGHKAGDTGRSVLFARLSLVWHPE